MARRNGNPNGNAEKAALAKKLADQALETLSTALAAGKSETLLAYLAAMARFHSYSFGNIMLIYSQRPDATRVAGFRTWRELDRYVKKGEKGIVIIAPMMLKRRDSDGPNGHPVEHDGDKPDTFIRFRAVHVFDVSQTEGEALPEHSAVGGDPAGHIDRLKTVVADRGIGLEYSDELGSAEGKSSGGRITLRTGLSSAEEFSTLAHELAHEMLHHTDDGDRPTKTVRETEAEAVAFVVSQAVGLDTNTASSDYIQIYAGTKETLAASLDRIQHTATAIISAVLDDEPVAMAATR